MWHYDDLGIYRILCEFDKETELVRYYEDTIAKLEEYDREHKAELVKTLTAYFNNDFSLQKAADELYVTTTPCATAWSASMRSRVLMYSTAMTV